MPSDRHERSAPSGTRLSATARPPYFAKPASAATTHHNVRFDPNGLPSLSRRRGRFGSSRGTLDRDAAKNSSKLIRLDEMTIRSAMSKPGAAEELKAAMQRHAEAVKQGRRDMILRRKRRLAESDQDQSQMASNNTVGGTSHYPARKQKRRKDNETNNSATSKWVNGVLWPEPSQAELAAGRAFMEEVARNKAALDKKANSSPTVEEKLAPQQITTTSASEQPARSSTIDMKGPTRSSTIDMNGPARSNTIDMKGPTRSDTVEMKEQTLAKSDTIIMEGPTRSNTVIMKSSMKSTIMDGPTRSNTVFMEEPAEIAEGFNTAGTDSVDPQSLLLSTESPAAEILRPSTPFPRRRAAATDDVVQHHHTQKRPHQIRHSPYSRSSRSDKTRFDFDAKPSTFGYTRKGRRQDSLETRQAIYSGSFDNIVHKFASLTVEDSSWTSAEELSWRPSPQSCRPGLQMSQNEFNKYKLDLLVKICLIANPEHFWKAPRFFPREAIFYAFTELSLRLPSTMNFSGLRPYELAKFDGFDNAAAYQYALPTAEVKARAMMAKKGEPVPADNAMISRLVRLKRSVEVNPLGDSVPLLSCPWGW